MPGPSPVCCKRDWQSHDADACFCITRQTPGARPLMAYGLALLTALLGWWLSTGVILYLNHLPTNTYRWSLAAATVLLGGCLYTLPTVATDPGTAGVLLAFAQGLGIWAWLEMSYLMGFVTGPSAFACPPGTRGWRRFRLALGTSLYHELTVLLAGAAVFALTWDAANQVASWTFATLWLMRWSAKLNLFLGVANFHHEWLPEKLRYLSTYIERRPMNLLFPVSILLSTGVAIALFLGHLSPTLGASRLGDMLVCTLLLLAILEHWFLVLPLRDGRLWEWALRAANVDKTSTKTSTKIAPIAAVDGSPFSP